MDRGFASASRRTRAHHRLALLALLALVSFLLSAIIAPCSAATIAAAHGQQAANCCAAQFHDSHPAFDHARQALPGVQALRPVTPDAVLITTASALLPIASHDRRASAARPYLPDRQTTYLHTLRLRL